MIAIGADHGGYKLKEEVKRYLEEKGIEVKDFGTYSEERADYPDIAKSVAKSVQSKEADKGILICRSGYGMSMVANKFRGVRSAPCFEETAAKFSRMHNDANVLSMGAGIVGENLALEIVDTFLNTAFSGDARHQRRIDLIEKM